MHGACVFGSVTYIPRTRKQGGGGHPEGCHQKPYRETVNKSKSDP